jgi:hypothetical protein
MVVNRQYSNIQYQVKRCREKLYRIKANIYKYQQNILKENENKKADDHDDHDKNDKNDKNKKTDNWFKKTLELVEKAQVQEQELAQLIDKRKKTKYKIPLGDMPENERYTKLHQESKYLMNIIIMICYRAETALADKLAPHFGRADDEIRALVKAITHLSIDIIPDVENRRLNITLYPLANNRGQKALAKIINQVNDTQTVYPGTALVMNFKIATLAIAPSQEV